MRAYIVENSEIIRAKLALLLEEIEGLEVVGQTGNAKVATESILRLQPDVALIDVKLSDGNGLDVLETIRVHGLKTRSIVMTIDPCSQYQKEAMKRGASYFIDKAKGSGNIRLILEQILAEHNPEVS